MKDPEQVLVAGATGFVGRRVVRHLAREGYRVVGTSRSPERAEKEMPELEWRCLDVERPSTFGPALRGCQSAIYLIHAMGSTTQYQEAEHEAAQRFLEAAEREGIRRIVYLGGVEPEGQASRHLRSRLDTGKVLRSGKVPTLELQAAMIIGAGSQSWTIVRDLAARLPFMVLPRWLDSRSEPVAIFDVGVALAHGLKMELSESAVFALPGPERLSAVEILQRCAHLFGIDPFLVRVPFVTPRLSSYWIRLVTRADKRIAEELVEGLRSDLAVHGPVFWTQLPEHRPLGFDAAARAALEEEEQSLEPGARATERWIRRMGRSFRAEV